MVYQNVKILTCYWGFLTPIVGKLTYVYADVLCVCFTAFWFICHGHNCSMLIFYVQPTTTAEVWSSMQVEIYILKCRLFHSLLFLFVSAAVSGPGFIQKRRYFDGSIELRFQVSLIIFYFWSLCVWSYVCKKCECVFWELRCVNTQT